MSKFKLNNLDRRHRRVRGKIKGTAERPRLSIFRSNKNIYAQLIDDEKGKTLVSIKNSEVKSKKIKKSEMAKELGALIAKKAIEKNIKKAVFDRGGYKYHGRVKALAEGARSGGLEF